MWIAITLSAALIQSLRFVLQKRLRMATLSTAGATLARFFYAWPMLLAMALGYGAIRGLELPSLPAAYWAYGLTGAATQILGTLCTVALFQHRNFAVGATFRQTEAMQAVIFGLILLGDAITPAAFGAILIGVLGIALLTDAPSGEGPRVLNRATALGLGSGMFFGISSVTYRGASLAMEGGDLLLRSLLGLAMLTLAQSVAMVLWLAIRDPGQIVRVLAAWRVASLVGLTSLLGSLGWFTAFQLQKAGLVKAVGQAELIFSFVFSTYIFGEKSTAREVAGILVLAASVILLVLVA